MTRVTTTLLMVSLLVTSGCAICASPGDYDYSAYGGRWQRVDRSTGRVGSALDSAGTQPESGTNQQPTPAQTNSPKP